MVLAPPECRLGIGASPLDLARLPAHCGRIPPAELAKIKAKRDKALVLTERLKTASPAARKQFRYLTGQGLGIDFLELLERAIQGTQRASRPVPESRARAPVPQKPVKTQVPRPPPQPPPRAPEKKKMGILGDIVGGLGTALGGAVKQAGAQLLTTGVQVGTQLATRAITRAVGIPTTGAQTPRQVIPTTQRRQTMLPTAERQASLARRQVAARAILSHPAVSVRPISPTCETPRPPRLCYSHRRGPPPMPPRRVRDPASQARRSQLSRQEILCR